MSQGWECPKCGQVWAPYVPSCTCKNVTTSISTDCLHFFDYNVTVPACLRCGVLAPVRITPTIRYGNTC